MVRYPHSQRTPRPALHCSLRQKYRLLKNPKIGQTIGQSAQLISQLFFTLSALWSIRNRPKSVRSKAPSASRRLASTPSRYSPSSSSHLFARRDSPRAFAPCDPRWVLKVAYNSKDPVIPALRRSSSIESPIANSSSVSGERAAKRGSFCPNSPHRPFAQSRNAAMSFVRNSDSRLAISASARAVRRFIGVAGFPRFTLQLCPAQSLYFNWPADWRGDRAGRR
jgi:hypothetical protein